MLREGKLSVEEADHRGEDMKFAVPLALADLVLRYLSKGLRLTVDNQEMDVAQLLASVRDSGTLGKIVDVTDHRGTPVEIIVE